MITRTMKLSLLELGYSPEDIRGMTPSSAHEILLEAAKRKVWGDIYKYQILIYDSYLHNSLQNILFYMSFIIKLIIKNFGISCMSLQRFFCL